MRISHSALSCVKGLPPSNYQPHNLPLKKVTAVSHNSSSRTFAVLWSIAHDYLIFFLRSCTQQNWRPALQQLVGVLYRSSSKDITELHAYILSLVERINKKFGSGNYTPIVWVERPVSLYEKIALYSIADVAVVTATRDGMNLVPYEYVVCRQGAPVCFAD